MLINVSDYAMVSQEKTKVRENRSLSFLKGLTNVSNETKVSILIPLRSLASIIKEKHETRFTSAEHFITLHSHAEDKQGPPFTITSIER